MRRKTSGATEYLDVTCNIFEKETNNFFSTLIVRNVAYLNKKAVKERKKKQYGSTFKRGFTLKVSIKSMHIQM